MATEQEKTVAHKILARFFDLPSQDMGGGLTIITLAQRWMPAEERDLIVKAVKDFISR